MLTLDIMVSSQKSTPRARNATATREAILAAATRQFARESYENVGLREIAGEVGVDPALICRYFGSKDGLFREALQGKQGDRLLDGVALADLPAHLASIIMEREDDSEEAAARLDRLLIILRSTSSPKAGAIISDAISVDFLDPLATRLDSEDARLRASLALSVLIGSIIVRNMMSIGSVCPAGEAQFRARLTSLLTEALERT